MIRIVIRKLGLPVLALALLAPMISGCKKNEVRSAMVPEVQVAAVEQRDVPVYRDWVGTLEGAVNATISAQVSGYLLSRNYEEGSIVTNGQVLFQIDDRTYKAALDQAMAKLGKSELDVKRYTPLAKTQAISQQELDDAIQANLANEAAVEAARLNYNFCKILSPVDGLAGLASAQVGDLIGPGSGALTTVAQIHPIRAYFSVDQVLMTKFQERMLAEGKALRGGNRGEYEGPSLELYLASGSVYPQKGKILFANNQVDVKTGTIRLVGEFPNPDGLLVPGMFVRVRALLTTEKGALLVPQSAVINIQGRYLIAVVGADNKVSIRPVTAGETVGQQWVVQGNLKAGDRVVAEGVQKVRDGVEVKPVPYAGDIAAAPAAQAETAKP
ncbi:MAG: efflux RND transporter periplasmic adaptor subunit [Verrucomicrobiales bacterium]|nr:efflux RND transporter periplasmic adaptor subunit [Verrucomicrobiales bacterium]